MPIQPAINPVILAIKCTNSPFYQISLLKYVNHYVFINTCRNLNFRNHYSKNFHI